jgi:hypothetical protein
MDATLERKDAVESIQSAQSMQAMYLKQPMEMISELKAFARECVVGIPVEIGLGESREAGVFMIDRTLRTAHVANLTIELSTMSFSQPTESPTFLQRLSGFWQQKTRVVRIDTSTQGQIEVLLPDVDAASRFCHLANAIASIVRGHKKTNGSKEISSIPTESMEFAQQPKLAEETDDAMRALHDAVSRCQPVQESAIWICRQPKKSAAEAEVTAEPKNAGCWSGAPLCEECHATPSSEITASHVPQSYSNDHAVGPQSLPNGVKSAPSQHNPERGLFVDLKPSFHPEVFQAASEGPVQKRRPTEIRKLSI